MGLTAIRRSLVRKLPNAGAAAIDPAPIATPLEMTPLDGDSYEPLANMADEISRELGGDGLLVTWHQDAGQTQHLFAGGVCATPSETLNTIAEIGASAFLKGGGGAKSHWRTLADEPTSGVLTTSIPAERGVLTITTLFKRIGRSTRMRAGETAARLLPLLQPFFRIWLSRMHLVATARALTAIVNDSDVGVLLLDCSGQVTFANNSAEELMARNDGLRRKDATVTGDNMADTLRLHAAIEIAVGSGGSKSGRPVQRIVALRRREAPALMLAIIARRDVSNDGAGYGAIIYIVDPDQDLQPLVEPVCSFYGLSPAETRLACTLAAGNTLAEAAALLNVREQTARSYLKQIFLKTNTNRQAQLVRLLLLSAVRAGHRLTPVADHPQTGVIERVVWGAVKA